MAKSIERMVGESGGAIEVLDDGAGGIIQKFNDNAQIAAIADPTDLATSITAISAVIDALEAAGIIIAS